MGIAFGSFGPLLESTEAHFRISRTASTMGMSVLTLALGLLSPILGRLTDRMPVKTLMIGGALSSAAGYWGLALAPSFAIALPMYALIGGGIGVLALLGPLTIVNRWFPGNRGRILGLVNLPVAIVALPYLLADVIPRFGRTTILLGLGSTFILLLPFLLLLIERPRSGRRPEAELHAAAPRPRSWRANLWAMPRFWLLSLGVGLVSASATAFVVHIVPFAVGSGLSLRSASSLLSAFAMAGLAGTVLIGWISDRIGSPMTLAVVAALQAGLWWALPHGTATTLFPIAIFLGLCAVPINVLHGAAVSELVPPDDAGRALGFSYAIKLPFLFGLPPLVALLFERTGSYQPPFAAVGLALALATFLFLALAFGKPPGRRPA